MPKKQRLKMLSRCGSNSKEAQHAMLSLDPRNLKLKEGMREAHPNPKACVELEEKRV